MKSGTKTLFISLSVIVVALIAAIYIIRALFATWFLSSVLWVGIYTKIIPLHVHKNYVAFISSKNHTIALKSIIESDQVALNKIHQFSLADVPNLPNINGLFKTDPCKVYDDCLVFLGRTTVNLTYHKIGFQKGMMRKIYFRQSFDHGKNWTEEEIIGTGLLINNGGQSGNNLWVLANLDDNHIQANLIVRSESGGPWKEKTLNQSESQIYDKKYNNVALTSDFNRFFNTKYKVESSFQKNPFILPPPNWANTADDAFAYSLNENRKLMFWVDGRLRQMTDVVLRSNGGLGNKYYDTILDDAYALFVTKSEDGGKTWTMPYQVKNFDGYDLVNVFIYSDQKNARILYKTKVRNWPGIPTDYVVGKISLSFFP